MNDLERNIKSNIKFFADDTMLFSVVKGPLISAMEFNPDPTKQATEVLFSCKKSSVSHTQLTMISYLIQLYPLTDIYEEIIKAKKHVGMLKHLSKFLPLKTLDQMYKALVHPHIDYCLNQSPFVSLNSQMGKVERIQYQTALSGAWRGSSRSKLYEELGWEYLSNRRKCRSVLQIHKIFNKDYFLHGNVQIPSPGLTDTLGC